MHPATRSFLDESVRYLRDVYLERLERAARELTLDDVWWRPHEGVISIGTILTHLEGNVRQWILASLGREVDRRDRDAEFAATSGPGAPELLAALRHTVERSCEEIAALDEERLARTYTVQGNTCTGQAAVYHVVEHFSWHTGQVLWITKMRHGGPAVSRPAGS